MNEILRVDLVLNNGNEYIIEGFNVEDLEIDGLKKQLSTYEKYLFEKFTCSSFFIDIKGQNTIKEIEAMLKESDIRFIEIMYMKGKDKQDVVIIPESNLLSRIEKTKNGNMRLCADREIKSINIRYTHEDLIRLDYIEGKSDWIDLRAAESVELKKGESKLISLGVAMELPDGYEAHITPRSSTLKSFGLIQGNHFGVVDKSYSGNDDIWKFSAYALRDTKIEFNDRICQFRIEKNQPKIKFNEQEELKDVNRGGFGTTGKK